MCLDCWEDYDSPTVWNEACQAALESVQNLYREHPSGGLLHIVTDDWNIDDSSINWCLSLECQRACGRPVDQLELDCANKLLHLSEEERASVLHEMEEKTVVSIGGFL